MLAKVPAFVSIQLVLSFSTGYLAHGQDQGNRKRTIPTISAPAPPRASLPWYGFIYEPWVPKDVRRQLDPLYRDEADAISKLRAQRTVQAMDVASDLLGSAGATAARSAPETVARSAGKYAGTNAALDANSPPSGEDAGEGEIYTENNQVLLNKIIADDQQIRSILKQNGLDQTIGPPDHPVDISSILSGEELARAFLRMSTPDAFLRQFDILQQQRDSLDKSLATVQQAITDTDHQRNELARQLATQPKGESEQIETNIPIPAGWVPCTCPDRHPNAGLFIRGQRYHSAALSCDQIY